MAIFGPPRYTSAQTKTNPFIEALFFVWVGLVVAGIAAGIWAIVFASMNWQRGIYAGMHGNDAKALMTKQMSSRYGAELLGKMRYKGELKTHLVAGSLGPQMRVMHFVGPNGARYCASEWPSGANFVVNVWKGC